MFGVYEFEQFDRRAILDDERDADTVGWAVRRNQDFAAGKLGGEVGHFKRDVRHSPDEIGNLRVRFEAHPFHTEFAFLVTDDKEFQMLQVGLPRLRFGSWDPDVVIPAHCFSSGRIGATFLFYSLPRFEPRRAFRKHNRAGLNGTSRTAEIDWTCGRPLGEFDPRDSSR